MEVWCRSMGGGKSGVGAWGAFWSQAPVGLTLTNLPSFPQSLAGLHGWHGTAWELHHSHTSQLGPLPEILTH
eukprot:350116-Chlamydomonas_euryale.AAC.3